MVGLSRCHGYSHDDEMQSLKEQKQNFIEKNNFIEHFIIIWASFS